MLDIRLLGTPEVRLEGVTLVIPRKQPRALLYRLASSIRPLTRGYLTLLFWPDQPDKTGRRNLTRLLVLLRESLPQAELLLADSDTIRLNEGRCTTDIALFHQLVGEATGGSARGSFKRAAQIVRGPFLDGFYLQDAPEFEEWMESDRRAWERRVFDLYSTIAELDTAARDYPAAIASARILLQLDPCAEEVHRRLIELFAATGDRHSALQQFEECALVLERALGVPPMPETRAVYEAVLRGRVAIPEDAHTHLLGAPPSALPVEPTAEARDGSTLRSRRVDGSPESSTTPLIGRARELKGLTQLVSLPSTRLLTITGTGGVGKTRLALELMRVVEGDFADGAVFVSLAPLSDASLLPSAVLDALRLPESGKHSMLERLSNYLRERQLLLVLDNFEHLLAAASDLVHLLGAAPGLKIVVTSRATLRLSIEQTYALEPLRLADPDNLPSLEEFEGIEAVSFFLARVRMRIADFAPNASNAREIASICERLDGLPLAIELAAARTALLSPRALLARLSRPLTLLTSGARDLPERQRSLHSTIEWSYRLLDLGEQLLFERLACFAGGWDLEAAESVSDAVSSLSSTPLDLLDSLLTNFLVQRTTTSDGEVRFTMLATIREFALHRLELRDATEGVQRAHARHYAGLAERAIPHLRGAKQNAWLDKLDLEHDNIRAALQWYHQQPDSEAFVRFAVSLHWYWFARGWLSEGRTWIHHAMERFSNQARNETGDQGAITPQLLFAQCCFVAGHLAAFQGDLAPGRALLEESVALCHSIPERAAMRLQHDALMWLMYVAAWHSDFDTLARRSTEYSEVVKALDEPWTNAMAAFNRGRMYLFQSGDIESARPLLLQAESLLRRCGDAAFLRQTLIDLGNIALMSGARQEAQERFGEVLEGARSAKDRFAEADVLNNLGEIARMDGDFSAATKHYETSLAIHRDLDAQQEIPRQLHNLAFVALHIGDSEGARHLFFESLQGYQAVEQHRSLCEPIAGMACLLTHSGAPDKVRRAAILWGAAEAIRSAEHLPYWPADRAEHEHFQRSARQILGDDEFLQATSEGALLSREQAVDLFLAL